MDYSLLMDTAVLAGEIMLKNGSETSKVEETIKRVLEMEDLKHIEAVVMSTSIVATISNPSIEPITVVRRITKRDNKLNRIYLVDETVEEFCTKKITLDETFKKLKEIKKHTQYRKLLIDFCLVLIPAFFTIMFNGTWIDVISALICGIILVLTLNISKIIKTNEFITNLVSIIGISFVAVLVNKLIGSNVDLVIIGAIMPLVPGIAITNATRDTLSGDYMSGVAKLLEALIKAVPLALGVAIGMGLANMLIGGTGL